MGSLPAVGNLRERTSAYRRCTLESGHSAFVKSFGRREAYESLRGTNPRAADDGLWVFLFSAERGEVATGSGSAGRDAICPKLSLDLMALPVRIAGKRELRGVADDGWRELERWPQWGCCGRELRQAVPGHGEFLPVGGVQCGGARG